MFPISILAVACTGPGGDSAGAEPVGWEIEADAVTDGAFLSVWGPAPDDIWAVGGQPDAGVAWRRQGGQWSPVEGLPEVPLLNWVHGTGTDDIWLGGLQGTLLHYDGSSWADHTQQTEAAVWGVHAVGVDEVYAVGGESVWGGETGFVWRFDGSTWSDITPTGDNTWFKVHHDGNTLFVVGEGGNALAGEPLTRWATGTAVNLVTVTSVDGEAGPVIVGGVGTGIVAHAPQGTFEIIAQTSAGLSGVRALSNDRVLVTGERGWTAWVDPTTGEVEAIDAVTDAVLHGAWGFDDRVYAVGGNLYTAGDTFEGTILSMEVTP